MAKTRKRGQGKARGKTMRHGSLRREERLAKHVIPLLLEMLDTIKVFHWRTHIFATHKATDGLHEELSGKVDEFVEVLLGKIGKDRFKALRIPSVHVQVWRDNAESKRAVGRYVKELTGLSHSADVDKSADVDLLNLRDEMVAHLNKYLYLLTLS
jgi:DNA-binding ferritin-like protein